MTTSASPTSARTSATATLRMPSGSVAPEAGGVLAARDPEEHDAAQAQAAPPRRRPCAACRGVCWTTPGMEPIGAGSLAPSLTNSGSTSSAGCEPLSPRPGGASRASSAAGGAAPAAPPDVRGTQPSLGGPAGRALALARAHDRLAGLDRRQRAGRRRTRRAPRPGRHAGLAASTSTRSPCSSAVFAVAGPMQATTVVACGLPAMPTRLRTVELDGEDDRVELAALDRLAHLGGRRRRPHGAVGGDVVDLPAEACRPATRVSVAMSARGRKTRLIGSSTSSNGGQSSSRPLADCSASAAARGRARCPTRAARRPSRRRPRRP